MKIIRIFCLLICILSLGSCVSTEEIPERDKRIIIGAVLPRSGEYAQYGRSIIAGLQFKIDEIDRKGGINGRRVKLIIIDNRSDPQISIKAFRSLVENYHASVIVGAYASSNTFLLKNEAKQYRVPLIVPTATNVRITDNNPYVFRICYNDDQQGRAIALFALHHSLRRCGVLIDLSDDADYSRGLAATFRKYYEKGGASKVEEVGFYRKDKDYKAAVAEINARNLDAVFIPTYHQSAAKMIRELRGAGFKKPLLGGDGWDEKQLWAKLTDVPLGQIYFSGMFYPRGTQEDIAFVRLIREKFGIMPDACLAQGYNAGIILGEALKQGVSAHAIRKGMYMIRNYPVAGGKISITASGDAERDVFFKTLKKENNKVVVKFIESVGPVKEKI